MSQINKILISGGTGLVGSALSQHLQKNNLEVAVLSRRSSIPQLRSFQWDYKKGYIDPEAMEFADVVVHLAGENISGSRWTVQQKKKIIDSRVKTGELLVDAISKAKNKPQKLISASAVGYYGAVTSEKIFKESDPPGNDFLGEVVNRWEKSVNEAKKFGLKLHKLRIGIVLSQNGGALEKMSGPVRLGLGSALGSGKQWMPWISLNDLVRSFSFLIDNEVDGEVFNAVAPDFVNNEDFMKTLAKAMDKPYFLPKVPAFTLKLALGEMADIVLEGSRVSSDKLIKAGFTFEDTELLSVLNGIYG